MDETCPSNNQKWVRWEDKPVMSIEDI
jgi:hypothetical protein